MAKKTFLAPQLPAVPTVGYERYKSEIADDIQDIIQHLGCQPILFVGSGLSKRYFGGPSWDELLGILAERCPLIDKSLTFYKQIYSTPQLVGEFFASKYHEWAWSDGKSNFPDSLFHDGIPSSAYIKHAIATILDEMTPLNFDDLKKIGYAQELESFNKIKPHAVITTNFDKMLETIFPDHHPVIGQQILKSTTFAIGEIFKIHGCVSAYGSLVFTEADYNEFVKKKKYLSAKLLTFFSEHPLLFIGYSASDPNIRAILSDIDEALPEAGGIIPNVYILDWNPSLSEGSTPPREKLISTSEDRSVRVKLIEAEDFAWVFDAFGANPPLNDVNPKILRALIARSYEMVRHDIPKMAVHADFEMLSESVKDSTTFGALFGIANIKDYSTLSAKYPYSATELGRHLGGQTWHLCNKLIDKITSEKGVNIRESDNKYHICEKINKTKFRKYSDEALKLLTSCRDGKDYTIDLD